MCSRLKKYRSRNLFKIIVNNGKLDIRIFLDYHNLEKSKIRGNMTIEPYGTKFISISKHDGSISFISKLGICRCAVFKNPSIDKENFDVFHS